jgi:hypothetical protein
MSDGMVDLERAVYMAARRMARVRNVETDEDGSVSVPLEAIGALCLGTDIAGPDFVAMMRAGAKRLCEVIDDAEPCMHEGGDGPCVESIVMGHMGRMFWIGYAAREQETPWREAPR